MSTFLADINDDERDQIRRTHIPHQASDGYGFPASDAATGQALKVCVMCSSEQEGNEYWPCSVIRLLAFYEAHEHDFVAVTTPTPEDEEALRALRLLHRQ